MAVTGKQFSGVVYRFWTDIETLQYQRILLYDRSTTSEEEISGLYATHGLAWDAVESCTNAELRLSWLPQCYPTPAGAGGRYATDEAAMLDLQNYIENIVPANPSNVTGNWGAPVANAAIRYVNGAWQTFYGKDLGGSPEALWGSFPDANSYNITTAAPFGTGLGNGLIRAQALYYHVSQNSSYGPLVGSQYPDPPNPVVSDTGFIPIGVVDVTFIFTPIEDGGGNSLADGGGDGSTATDSLTVRSWGFSLDGHDFYVLRLGDSGSLIYDVTTGQWSEWITPGRTNWRPHIGQNWIGLANIDTAAGQTDVFCGDDATGTIWQLNTSIGRDERDTAGTIWPDDKITKVVTGGLQVTSRDVVPCGAIELDLALGNPTQTGASITLETSDDLGRTWVNCGSVVVASGVYTTPVEWNGLGTITAPGRIFRITDDGMSERIGGATLR